jgi:hypothetical protein
VPLAPQPPQTIGPKVSSLFFKKKRLLCYRRAALRARDASPKNICRQYAMSGT